MKIPIHTYILAGGKSSRFGAVDEDKARALLAGQPLIIRLAEQIAPLAASITVVADVENKYTDLGLTTIADLHPGLGPLAGLERALIHQQESQDQNPAEAAVGGFLLLLSCDLVEIRPPWVQSLCNATEHSTVSNATAPQVIVFVDAADEPTSAGRIHPMPGLYHHTLLPLITQRIHDTKLGFQSLIRSTPHLLLPRPADWPNIAQINTTTDWKNVDSHPPTAPPTDPPTDPPR